MSLPQSFQKPRKDKPPPVFTDIVSKAIDAGYDFEHTIKFTSPSTGVVRSIKNAIFSRSLLMLVILFVVACIIVYRPNVFCALGARAISFGEATLVFECS